MECEKYRLKNTKAWDEYYGQWAGKLEEQLDRQQRNFKQQIHFLVVREQLELHVLEEELSEITRRRNDTAGRFKDIVLRHHPTQRVDRDLQMWSFMGNDKGRLVGEIQGWVREALDSAASQIKAKEREGAGR